MSLDRRAGGSVRPRQAVDAVTYAVAVVGTVFAIGLATAGAYAYAIGEPVWVAVKYFLFVAGFGLAAYSTLRLWPARPADDEALVERSVDDDEDDAEVDDRGPGILTWLLPGGGTPAREPGSSDRERGRPVGREETRFQRLVQSLPPVRWIPLAPERRVRPPLKLMLGALLVLLVSFLMETVLRVGYPS